MKDITADREFVRELVGKYQSRSTPTIIIGDEPNEEIIIGFEPDRLLEMIGP